MEQYEFTLDLDVVNCARDINDRQEDGESVFYLRQFDGKVSMAYAGFDVDMINSMVSCMLEDEVVRNNILQAVKLYLENEGE